MRGKMIILELIFKNFTAEILEHAASNQRYNSTTNNKSAGNSISTFVNGYE